MALNQPRNRVKPIFRLPTQAACVGWWRMSKFNILEIAANFNAATDYDIEAALALTSTILRHAHTVQLARIKNADPQLELPIEIGNDAP